MVLVQKEIKRVTIRPNGTEIQIRPPLSKTKTIDFLLIAGGGGGSHYFGGGGGAGGVIQCTGYELEIGTYPVVIGVGGSGIGTSCDGIDGGNSCFGDFIACGGGAGGGYPSRAGHNGGSGGGAGYYNGTTAGTGIAGQGYDAGNKTTYGGGGGGGAGGMGCNASGNYGGQGGPGIQTDIDGSCKWYAGGGSGYSGYGYNTSANCGGTGSGTTQSNATCYGAGGGGTCANASFGNGYQGIFIVRYPTACGYDITGGCCYTCNNYIIHCFTSNGTLTVN